MLIYGLNKTTLLDYPGRVAATIFLGGCNFRCPFCHNKDLVLLTDTTDAISTHELLAFLEKRRHVLTGVCITGGEPTLHSDLADLLKNIKDLGYCVKLDTNGSNPRMLDELLSENLLDYIAMDIKNDKAHYAMTIGCNEKNGSSLTSFSMSDIETSVSVIQTCGLPYEFRTTVVKQFHNAETFENIANWLDGSLAYYLQNYEETPNVLCPGFTSYSKEELHSFARTMQKTVQTVEIRGI